MKASNRTKIEKWKDRSPAKRITQMKTARPTFVGPGGSLSQDNFDLEYLYDESDSEDYKLAEWPWVRIVYVLLDWKARR